MDRFVYVDTETTDKTPGQIARLAFILAEDTNITAATNHYFSVGKMSPGAEAIHHLSPAVLKGLSSGQSFGDTIFNDNMLDAFFTYRTFVAHNVAFDLRFVKAEFERCGHPYTPAKTLCTMKAMTPICRLKGPYGFKWPRVEEALRWLKIDPQEVLIRAKHLFLPKEVQSPQGVELGFHDARYDVTAVMLIHQWLREREVADVV